MENPGLYVFDLLRCDGKDLRNLPLISRKLRLRSIVPQHGERLLYCNHIDQDGEGLFRLACGHDLESIVAKRKDGFHGPQERTTWLKIRNTGYSQWAGRAGSTVACRRDCTWNQRSVRVPHPPKHLRHAFRGPTLSDNNYRFMMVGHNVGSPVQYTRLKVEHRTQDKLLYWPMEPFRWTRPPSKKR